VLLTGALMLGVYTIVKPAADRGWSDSQTLGLGAISVALLAAFIVRESRAHNPLVPLRIFRIRNVWGANAVQALMVAGFFGLFFLGALYLQRVLGYGPLKIGLAFMPLVLVVGAMSVGLVERLQTRFGAKNILLPGLALVVAGLLLFTRAPVHGRYLTDVLPGMLLLGTGFGLCFPSILTLALSGATERDAGLASGLNNTFEQIGGAFGTAVLATVASAHTAGLLKAHEALRPALNGGFRLAFTAGIAFPVLGLVASTFLVRGRRRRRASVTALEPLPAAVGDC